ncbi:MAG: ABC transporter permease [Armatimonadota bacterium]|nr:ABC transporter permease [Armatimonadota bacterium]MDR7520416.1 ABC transporter permease [Armatimonadota bacterium]MDR7549148.1 ABC transporter permease [Armatimonadota bacterium]
MRARRDPVRLTLFVLLGLVAVFMLAPIIFVMVFAFSSASYLIFPPPGYSLRWFAKLFQQEALFRAALNSLVIAATATLVSLIVGTLASLALVRYQFFGREVLRALFLAPLIVPRIAFGVAMLIYAVVLGRFGGLDSLILAHLMVTLPFAISILSAALVSADRSLEEAAADLGASPLVTFWKVTLPQIRTGLAVSGFFAFIISWDQVETSLFLVKTENMTLPVAMFYYLQRQQDPVIAALSACLIGAAVAAAVAMAVTISPRDLQRILSAGGR